ncbi:hypothetical protein [Jiella sp. M17.18]
MEPTARVEEHELARDKVVEKADDLERLDIGCLAIRRRHDDDA